MHFTQKICCFVVTVVTMLCSNVLFGYNTDSEIVGTATTLSKAATTQAEPSTMSAKPQVTSMVSIPASTTVHVTTVADDTLTTTNTTKTTAESSTTLAKPQTTSMAKSISTSTAVPVTTVADDTLTTTNTTKTTAEPYTTSEQSTQTSTASPDASTTSTGTSYSSVTITDCGVPLFEINEAYHLVLMDSSSSFLSNEGIWDGEYITFIFQPENGEQIPSGRYDVFCVELDTTISTIKLD